MDMLFLKDHGVCGIILKKKAVLQFTRPLPRWKKLALRQSKSLPGLGNYSTVCSSRTALTDGVPILRGLGLTGWGKWLLSIRLTLLCGF